MRGIQVLFLSVLLILLLVFSFSQFKRFIDTKSEIETYAKTYNDLFYGSAYAHIREVENKLDLIAERLGASGGDIDPTHAKTVLREMMRGATGYAGFGLFDQNGAPIALSSAFSTNTLQIFNGEKNGGHFFKQSLFSRSMVVGRAYRYEEAGTWILPMRKSIRGQDGKTVAVLVAGLNLTSNMGMLDGTAEMFPSQYSMLLNSDGLWRIFLHNLDNTSHRFLYENPIPHETAINAAANVQEKYGYSPEEVKTLGRSITYYVNSEVAGEQTLSSIRYIDRYHLWVLTSLPPNAAREQFLNQGFTLRVTTFAISFIAVAILFIVFLRKEKRGREELLHRAHHDFLTGLSNRYALNKISERWVVEKDKEFSLFFIDLDNFKNINDAFGHSCGDIVLVEVAKRIQALLPHDAEAIRHGGDEFAVFIPYSDTKTLDALAHRVVDEVSKPYIVYGMKLHVSASVGISRFPIDGSTLEGLMVAADIAMHNAKRRKNSHSYYNREQQDLMKKKVEIENHLRHALQSDEIFMVFQPQISRNGTLHGAEALVRWISPELGFIRPDQFISVAEESGLIGQLGDQIVEKSVAEFARMREICGDHSNDLRLSINASVKQILAADFRENLLDVFQRHAVPSEQITIEITETLFIEDASSVLPILHSLRKEGMEVALDDFGTGYSSLSTLRTLPIDELKIDKSFIDNIVDSPRDGQILASIIDLGHTMDLRIVAEGIEDPKQVALLETLRCDTYQGYYFSKPIKMDELIELVQKKSI